MYCLCRESMNCWTVDNGQKLDLGYVKNPFKCCEFIYEVQNPAQETEFTVIGKAICQKSLWFGNCYCKPWNRVEFQIYRPGQTEPCGRIIRDGLHCLIQCMRKTEGDVFTLEFPDGCSWQQKAMLVNTLLFIDYSIFERYQRN